MVTNVVSAQVCQTTLEEKMKVNGNAIKRLYLKDAHVLLKSHKSLPVKIFHLTDSTFILEIFAND